MTQNKGYYAVQKVIPGHHFRCQWKARIRFPTTEYY